MAYRVDFFRAPRPARACYHDFLICLPLLASSAWFGSRLDRTGWQVPVERARQDKPSWTSSLSEEGRWIILGLILFLAHLIQALSGFGAIVISVTLGALFFPIRDLPPLLVPLNVFLTAYLVVRYRREINREVLFGRILPFMGAGALLGLFLFEYLPSDFDLQTIFAALIVLLSLVDIYRMVRQRGFFLVDMVPGPIWIFLAGITHGLYASGGPLLVYALGRLPLSKGSFRSTLSAVWFTFNSAMTVYFFAAGHLDRGTATRVVIFLPVLIAGTALGEYLHHRVSEFHFRLLLLLLLLGAGLALLLK